MSRHGFAALASVIMLGLNACTSSAQRDTPLPPAPPAPSPEAPAASASGRPVPPTYAWTMSLTFRQDAASDQPAPTNGMNIVAHDGKLYAGMGTDGQPASVSQHSSYVFRKSASADPWQLDADFGPQTGRVGALESVQLSTDSSGRPIPGGPVSLLIAATNQNPGGTPKPVIARVRDDATGAWIDSRVSSATASVSQVREIVSHRDQVTGADLAFVAASPAPLGIYAGSYDPSAPGALRWNPVPEVQAASDRRKQKWFGMAEANGRLYASNNTGVFVRIDGEHPSWQRVADAAATGQDAATNPEWRGLVAVPNPTAVTGWPEQDMLVFSYANALWHMRAGGDHAIRKEYDLQQELQDQLDYPVPLAEAAFNRPNPVTTAGGAVYWPIGFDFAHGQPPAVDARAFLLLRDVDGSYTRQQIVDPSDPDRVLLLARDIVASPFASERGVLYATGYNSSVSHEPADRGTAWIAKGTAP